LTFPKVVMSLYMVTGNGEFLMNAELCHETVHFGKYMSKQCDVWSGHQISENRNKNDLSNKTQDLVGLTLKHDDNNLVNCGQQTTTNRLVKSHHTITISSKVT
jgi:hypothetical protein